MKNNKIKLLTVVLLAAVSLGSCSEWTALEPIGQNISTPSKSDPAAYAAYAAKIRAYKQSEHKLFYVAFDNRMLPSSPGQTLQMLPDSTDIIALRNPAALSELDVEGMRIAQTDFATRILCYVDADADGAQVIANATAMGYDGFVVDASVSQQLVEKLATVAGPGKSKMLLLEGSTLRLTGALNTLFDLNILPTNTALSIFDVVQQVDFARNSCGFSNDCVLLTSTIEGTILDNELLKRNMLPTMIALVTDLGPLGGLSIAGIESDYYHVGGNFRTARKTINALNTSK